MVRKFLASTGRGDADPATLERERRYAAMMARRQHHTIDMGEATEQVHYYTFIPYRTKILKSHQPINDFSNYLISF